MNGFRVKTETTKNSGQGGVFSACSSASSSELPGHLLDSAKIGSSYLQEQAGLGDGGFAKPVLLGAF